MESLIANSFGLVKDLDTTTPRSALKGFEPYFKFYGWLKLVNRLWSNNRNQPDLDEEFLAVLNHTPDEGVAEEGLSVIMQLETWFSENYSGMMRPDSRLARSKKQYLDCIGVMQE